MPAVSKVLFCLYIDLAGIVGVLFTLLHPVVIWVILQLMMLG